MMKRTIATIAALVAAVGLVSCSSDRFDKIPQNTGFFQHLQKNPYKEVPVDAYWASEKYTEKEWDQRVDGENAQGVCLRLTPVTLDYLVNRPADAKEMAEIQSLRQYLDDALQKELRKVSDDPKNNFHLVQKNGPGVLTVEVAILSVKTAIIGKNAAMKAVGVVTGIVGSVATRALGDSEDKGHICIAARIKDSSGRVVSESAKYMTGQSSLLGYDTKDFRKYAHQRASIDDWVKMVGKSCIVRSDEKITMPRFKLNPF